MPKPVIVDETQKDTKSRAFAEEMGIDRHERLVFSVSRLNGRVETDEETVRRLVEKLRNRGPGSFAASTLKGRTVRVERTERGFDWRVTQAGALVAEGSVL